MTRVRDYLRALGGRLGDGNEPPANWSRFQAVAGRGEVELATEVSTYVFTLENVLIGVRVFRDRLEAEQRRCRDALAQLQHNAHGHLPARHAFVGKTA